MSKEQVSCGISASLLLLSSVAAAQKQSEVTPNLREPTATASGQIEALPPGDSRWGIYYKDANGWMQLSSTPKTKLKERGWWKLFVSGATWVPGTDVWYPGRHAPMQIVQRKPTFYLRCQGDVPIFLIVQLQQKNNGRQVQIKSDQAVPPFVGSFFLNWKYEFNKSALRELSMTKISEDVMAVTPKSDLEPGEYLLTYRRAISKFGDSSFGYDFGIR